jgi:hypothetical protein
MMKADLHCEIVTTCRKLNAMGLNQGTSGNISVRAGDKFLLTPSGMDYDPMEPEDIVEMDFEGGYLGNRIPSTEWRFHHPEEPSRDRCRDPHPFDVLPDPCDPWALDSGRALHGRGGRRQRHPLRALRHTDDPSALRRGPWSRSKGAAPACWRTTAPS